MSEKHKTVYEKAREDEKRQEKELKKNLSIRERLMRRVKNVVVPVEFEDAQGKFTIPCRMMTENEQRTLMKLQDELQSIKGAEQYGEFIDAILNFVAYPDGICLDPELTLDFWKQGNYIFNDLMQILSRVISFTQERIKETQSFRKKRTRTIRKK